MKIGITSSSKHKVSPVRAAVSVYGFEPEVVTQSADSETNEQPIGLEEMIAGAENRIQNSGLRDRRDIDYIFSVENGVILTGGIKDLACVIVETSNGVQSIQFSQTVPMPETQYEQARAAGFESHTIGNFLATEGVVKDGTNPHFELGGVHRADLILRTVLVCLHELNFQKKV